jgi:hypothetical protein
MWGKLSPRCIIYLASKMLYELETHYLFMKLHPLLFFFLPCFPIALPYCSQHLPSIEKRRKMNT